MLLSQRVKRGKINTEKVINYLHLLAMNLCIYIQI